MRRFTTTLFLALSLFVGLSAVASAQFTPPDADSEYPAGTVGVASEFYFSEDLTSSTDESSLMFLYFELEDEAAAIELFETGVEETRVEGQMEESSLTFEPRTDDAMLWRETGTEADSSGVLMFREDTYVGYWVYTIEGGDATVSDLYDELFADGFSVDRLFPEGDQIPEGLAKF